MLQTKISCLVFIHILTSFALGVKADLKQPKTSKNILLQFNASKNLFEDLSGEDILEEIKEFEPNIVYYLHIQYIPTWVQFMVVQAHVYLHNVTLGYNIEKVPNKFVIGQNIGLVQNITASGEARFFLENTNPFNVTVLVTAVPYKKNAPIPGGCNMEFAVETAPWLQLNETGAMVAVSSQPAKSSNTLGLLGACDLPSMEYQAYHLYLPEKDFSKDTYFNFLRKMMSVSRIVQYGRKVNNEELTVMHHTFSAYHGTGSVFALVVSAGNSQKAAYVPAITFTCSPARYTDTCQVLTSTFSRSLCALVLFIGLFVCMFGHSFFETELFLMSTLMGGIISYILIAPHGLSDSTNVLIATAGGVTFGNCWLLLWWALGSPLLSILMASFSLGYLTTSVMFYTVFVDSPYLQSDLNYWLVFGCLVLLVGVLLAPQANRVNILACCVVGAYAAVVPIDHYVGANLKYIFINTLRRATVPDFNLAIIDPPFQTKDMILVGMWIVLALTGFVLQSQRFGSRAPFPPTAQPWRAQPPTPLVDEERPLLKNRPGASPGSDSVFT